MKQPEHDDHGGLRRDLEAIAKGSSRRELLRLMAGASLLSLAGCLGGGSGTSGPGGGGPPGSVVDPGTDSTCETIPQETQGPYPADGSNGPNALTLDGIVREDLRASFGGASGVAKGVPLTLTLTVLGGDGTCGPVEGYAVYVWHCDGNGDYSLYSQATAEENYLRGVQVTDAAGQVTFTTIFPGCYAGRMPHLHFEVFKSVDQATSGTSSIRTSQLAFPVDVCNDIYASSDYPQSAQNLSQISFATDNVFSDGVDAQLATVTGDVSGGYTATLTVGV